MSVAPGMRIGPYEVRERIGAGGMGEVWRGHDARLRRDAALKFLPPEFARDHERLARFRREAQTLAQLNHPNIAQIFGLHEEPGSPVCLAMEYVGGATLAEMIEQCRAGQGAGVGLDVRGGKDQMQPLADAHRTVTHGLPIDDALNITVQICEALEHAHEKGIIHRDLKPANVKVTPEGKVKVLDFGLAKAFSSEGSSGGAGAGAMMNAAVNDGTTDLSPAYIPAHALTASPTIPGVILGTAAYMSPEQARGKPVDRRTDIWALGCVLYEMLTGVGAFAKPYQRGAAIGHAAAQPLAHGRGSDNHDEPDTAQDILARILSTDPDWSLLPAETPAYLRGILRRCLQKDSSKRTRSAADVALQIEDVHSGASGTVPVMAAPAAAVSVPLWRSALPWAVALIAIASGVVAWMMKPAPAPRPVSRLTISLPPGQRLARLDQPAIAISPDGKNIVYVASQCRDREGAGVPSSGGQDKCQDQNQPPLPNGRGTVTSATQLYLRPLDSDESRPIAGTEGAVAPFFSPDGQWIGFFADGKLKKIPIGGGAAVTVANAPNPGGASWGNQGTLVLQGIIASSIGLQQVAQDGGGVQSLTRVGIGGANHRWPEFLPDGQGIIFAASPAYALWNNASVVLQSAAGAELMSLAQGSQPRYAASSMMAGKMADHLLYAQAGALMAAPFDARRQALTGPSVPVLQGLMQSISTGSAQYAVSTTGTLAYLAGSVSDSQSRMVWVSRNGAEEPLPAMPRVYQYPRISPDGRRVAIAISDQEVQLWVYDLARDTLTRLTFEGNANATPAWTPDGRRIAFSSNRADTTKPQYLYLQAADGSSGAERLKTSDYQQAAPHFSPDGKLLAFIEGTPETGRDIWVMNLDEAGKADQARKGQPFLNTPAEETAPRFSPDGKWLAYSSDESGRREIYVQPYPGPGGKWLISTEGGQEPVWNPKGGELFYRSGSRIMAVDIQVGQAFLPAGSENLKKPQAGMPAPPGFEAGKPKMLFDGPYLPTTGSFPWYDVTPDGQRFLMLKPVETEASAPTQINVVLNWFEELKQKVPVK